MLQRIVPLRPVIPANDVVIADEVMTRVRAFYHAKGNHPAEEIYTSLRLIVQTIEAIVNRKADPKLFISAADCGYGKTTALRFSIQVMLERGHKFGMVICLGRLEQIEAMVQDLGLTPDQYAVLAGKDAKTSDGRLFSELGRTEAGINDAPVLLTTHAQLEKRFQNGGHWQHAKAFYYMGSERLLRVWDEQLTFRKPLELTTEDLHAIAGTRQIDVGVKAYAQRLLLTVLKAEPGTDIPIPQDRLPIEDAVMSRLYDSQAPANLINAVKCLYSLARADNKVGIRYNNTKTQKDDQGEATTSLVQAILKFEINLPKDLLPVLVLDASAKDRPQYRDAPEPMVELPSPPKAYTNVTFNVWDQAAGRGALWKSPKQLQARIAQAVRAITANPGHRVLVVYPKAKWNFNYRFKDSDIPDGIEQALGRDHGRKISYVTWGNTNAVNRYADCSLIIFMSLYFFSNYTYENIGRAASDTPYGEVYDSKDTKRHKDAEIMTQLRQAANRGSMRMMTGLEANRCIVYLPMPAKSGLSKLLDKTFPGCNMPTQAPLRTAPVKSRKRHIGGKAASLITILDGWPGDKATYPELYRHPSLDMKQAHFSRLLASPETQEALAQKGWTNHRSSPSYLERLPNGPIAG